MKKKHSVAVIIAALLILSAISVALCFVLPKVLRDPEYLSVASTGLKQEENSRASETVKTANSDAESKPEEPPQASETAKTAGSDAESKPEESSRASETAKTAGSDAESKPEESPRASETAKTANSDAESKQEEPPQASETGQTANSDAENKPEESPQASETGQTADSDARTENSSERSPETEGLQDTAAPVFLYYRATPQIKVGSSFDVHKYIGYADDVDRNVDLKVAGSVDTSVEGTYQLKLTLTDDAGHTTSKDMKVSVVTQTSSGSSGGGSKYEFADFIADNKRDDTLVGIDVSGWQGDIDYDKIIAAGCEFVYMKLGGFDTPEFFTDSKFKRNFAEAKAHGMKIGLYWYGEESTREEVEASVRYMMEVLGGEAIDYPIAYDWEDYKNFEYHHMNLNDLNLCYEYFEEELAKYGYSACLYGSKNAQENTWTRPKKSPVWLAHYNSATSFAGDFYMWQQSNQGRIDGIKGDVDLDILYPDRLKPAENKP